MNNSITKWLNANDLKIVIDSNRVSVYEPSMMGLSNEHSDNFKARFEPKHSPDNKIFAAAIAYTRNSEEPTIVLGAQTHFSIEAAVRSLFVSSSKHVCIDLAFGRTPWPNSEKIISIQPMIEINDEDLDELIEYIEDMQP